MYWICWSCHEPLSPKSADYLTATPMFATSIPRRLYGYGPSAMFTFCITKHPIIKNYAEQEPVLGPQRLLGSDLHAIGVVRVPGKMVSKCTLRRLVGFRIGVIPRIRFISMFIARCIDTSETETFVYFKLILKSYGLTYDSKIC